VSRPSQPLANVPGVVAGPGAIAGALLLRDALQRADLDDQTRARILKNLAGVLPLALRPGKVAGDRTLRPDDLKLLIPSAAVSAAGLDPAKTPMPPPPVLWENAGNQLLVQLAGIQASLGDGFIELAIPVSCDQTGDTQITVTFVTGSPDRPSGGVTTTEDHPRGASVVIENWHEPLIAFAWQTVLIATSALSGVAGTDLSGRNLITNALAINADGLSVLPMAQHTFLQTTTLP
jgi:hypothetical protein